MGPSEHSAMFFASTQKMPIACGCNLNRHRFAPMHAAMHAAGFIEATIGRRRIGATRITANLNLVPPLPNRVRDT